MANDMAERTIVVTGGGSGLGACTAGVLAGRGAHVVVLDIDLDAARRTADDLAAQKLEATPLQADVTDPASVARPAWLDAAAKQAIASMPGQHRWGVGRLGEALDAPVAAGLRAVLLFGVLEGAAGKDGVGSGADAPGAPVPAACAYLRAAPQRGWRALAQPSPAWWGRSSGFVVDISVRAADATSWPAWPT